MAWLSADGPPRSLYATEQRDPVSILHPCQQHEYHRGAIRAADRDVALCILFPEYGSQGTGESGRR